MNQAGSVARASDAEKPADNVPSCASYTPSAVDRLFIPASVADIPEAARYCWDADVLLELSGADRIGEISARRTQFFDDLGDFVDEVTDSFFSLDSWGHAFGHRLREAVERRQTLWLGILPAHLLEKLRSFAGDPALVRVAGVPLDDGSLPVAINPIALINQWKTSEVTRRYLQRVLSGADSLRATRSAIHALREAGVAFRDRSFAIRMMVNPTFLAYLVVFVYSSLRALPVAFVPGFHGKVWVLWSIDMITAVPYTWGVLAMVAGRTFFKRVMGLIVTIVTFVSPYVYFWMHGRHYPPTVIVFVAAMIIGAIALEGFRWWRDRVVKRTLALSVS